MCGITGWVDFKRDLTNEQEMAESMAATLKKRGPDDFRVWTSRHAAFGHTRLVVVDPAGGAQPMTREQYTIVYNGELYNTEEIRKELLRKGYAFQGHSDTEVLLKAFIEWQDQCVDYLNGIFAFAVWNETKQELFMARDRLGVKPLFFKESNESLLFGSELKSILAHRDIKVEVDRTGLMEIFALGPGRTPGHGVFKDLKELRAAHALTYNENGLKIWRYWNVKSDKHVHSLNETAEHVRYLLKDAVERQLTADVPVCTFLSGGVDSSAISAFAAHYFQEHGRGPLYTYSIEYEENSRFFQKNLFQPGEDRPWIDKMQKYTGSIHHTSIIGQSELAEKLKEAMIARDLPGMADIDSSLLWFCEEIKRDFTVGLSGECADEIFGGYPWFHREELLTGNAFPWMKSLPEKKRVLNEKWRKVLPLEEYVHDRYNEMVSETPKMDGENGIERKRREMFYVNMVSFMAALLERKDRMSMGAGLEVRVPFADHRLVEYVWNIPWEMKMADGREKGILRKALEGVLPGEVLYRKKSPYPKTHHPDYTAEVSKMLGDILRKDSPLLEFFSHAALKELVDSGGSSFRAPWFGQLMTGPQLIAYFVQLNMWFEEYNVRFCDK
ncbi:asparagine synthase (glutamine-hydrolyzing) [Domibacillus epiphyticus]|uniref:asparagine synthase (glutamine-hydrolyzing) n=1 Tax=Domibacillus epiphyticus TaxID=1714355 RepID=A0A1V2A7M4_9BACI|nr:asparagine synthase (glutamine-hydrolyzing) [Domibacillus epiphyticus]OMP66999.1 asparagine synthase (glutamine-hydrolyzing) [Domibacillus epiphyticus]